MTEPHCLSHDDLGLRSTIGSRFPKHCEGHFACDSTHHVLGIALKAAVVTQSLPCPGSTLLDEINAFDYAEAVGAYLGQLNMVTVSSFCGPQGLIWGYDLCAPAEGHRLLGEVSRGDQRAELYDLAGLTGAFERLVGTLDDRRFPFMAGSHVPAAMKVKTTREPGVLFAALALGIPENRRVDACLLMENPGFIHVTATWEDQRRKIHEAMARSVLAVGENQRVRYRKVFVGVSSAVVRPGETGCAIALAPYFRLAGDAFVRGHSLTRLDLDAWEAATRERFLGHAS